jgi:hypothetical protein
MSVSEVVIVGVGLPRRGSVPSSTRRLVVLSRSQLLHRALPRHPPYATADTAGPGVQVVLLHMITQADQLYADAETRERRRRLELPLLAVGPQGQDCYDEERAHGGSPPERWP